MSKMTHTQRIKAVLEGKPTDRIPFIAWGPHLNLEDKNTNDFTKAVIAYQNQHNFDILKVMQNGLYATEDWGQVIDPCEDSEDACYKKTRTPAFKSAEDWKTAYKRDVHKGAYAREIENIRILCDHYGKDLPVLPTIFGPTRLLFQLSGYPQQAIKECPNFMGDRYMDYVKNHESEYFHVMDVLTEQTIDLMNAYIDVGAAGFFYCSHGQFPGMETDEEYEKYVRPYDVRCLEAIQGRAWFTMLHVCGAKVCRMEQMVTLPCQAINWEDRSPENPSLGEVRAMTDKVLMGGVDRHHDFAGASRELVKEQLKQSVITAKEQAGAKFIAAIGCEGFREIAHRYVVWDEVMDEVQP